jgi:hypothetical protein
VIAVGFAIGAVLYRDPVWLVWVGTFGLLALLMALVFTAEAPGTRCAVCSASLFSGTGCMKHASARRLLGSYRLQTACGIILTGSYRCHHCGELVLLEKKPSPQDAGDPQPAKPARSPGKPVGAALPKPVVRQHPPAASSSAREARGSSSPFELTPPS